MEGNANPVPGSPLTGKGSLPCTRTNFFQFRPEGAAGRPLQPLIITPVRTNVRLSGEFAGSLVRGWPKSASFRPDKGSLRPDKESHTLWQNGDGLPFNCCKTKLFV